MRCAQCKNPATSVIFAFNATNHNPVFLCQLVMYSCRFLFFRNDPDRVFFGHLSFLRFALCSSFPPLFYRLSTMCQYIFSTKCGNNETTKWKSRDSFGRRPSTMDKWISRSICIQIKRYEYKEIHNSDLGGGIEAGGWERRQQNEVASSESRGGSTERDQQRERGSRIGSAIPSGIDSSSGSSHH